MTIDKYIILGGITGVLVGLVLLMLLANARLTEGCGTYKIQPNGEVIYKYA